jgi:hypothetical protein
MCHVGSDSNHRYPTSTRIIRVRKAMDSQIADSFASTKGLPPSFLVLFLSAEQPGLGHALKLPNQIKYRNFPVYRLYDAEE